MKITGLLSSFIYIISSGLLFPVLLLLCLLSIVTLYKMGMFLAEYLNRKKVCSGELQVVLDSNNLNHLYFGQKAKGFLETVQRKDKILKEEDVAFLLEQGALDLRGSLDLLQILVRVGPMLGLMGTLIPMGTGLAALSQGDMARLSSDLVIAFTTTVVGLAQGGLAYAMLSIKRRWVEQEILQMEYIAEKILSSLKGENEVSKEK